MQELRQEAEIRSKAKPKVGTVRSDSLNYSFRIPAFDSSHIPARAASIKSEIKLSIVRDILGTNKSPWNPTVLVDRSKAYHEQVTVNQLHFEIRRGIRDASNPPASFSKIYEGVDSRNDFTGWNTSVQFSLSEHKNKHLLA